MNISHEIYFLEILPVEMLEHIFSFCSGKDLLSLTETCSTFKDVVTQSSKLIEKIAFVLSPRNSRRDHKHLVEAVMESRKFRAAKLIFPVWFFKYLENFIRLAEKLYESEHNTTLEIHVNWKISFEESFREFLRRLFPRIKSCSMTWTPSQAELSLTEEERREVPPRMLLDINCDLLTCLTAKNIKPYFLADILLACKNLKSLTLIAVDKENHKELTSSIFYDYDHKIEGQSFWKLLTFKLKKLKITAKEVSFNGPFNDFLVHQTELEEINLPGRFWGLPPVLYATLKKITFDTTICSTVWLDCIPHCYYRKVDLLMGDKQTTNISLGGASSIWPHTVADFEKNFLAFIERNSNIQSFPISHVVRSLRLSSRDWRDRRVLLSETFIKKVVSIIPNLKKFFITSNQPAHEIKRIIDETGVDLGKLCIVGYEGRTETYEKPDFVDD